MRILTHFKHPLFKWVIGVWILLLVLVGLQYFGFIWHNSLLAWSYPVKGLDVSNHQGQIDWEMVRAENKFDFVFIKATEGSDFLDRRFKENWDGARKNGFQVGAYHFLSSQSSGINQANWFISIVPDEEDALPPVLDIEVSSTLDRTKIRKEIKDFVVRLEQHYKKRPILYVTYETYEAFVKGAFDEYPLWIRDIIKRPSLSGTPWIFWQYSNRGRVRGIRTYVDINVFKGNAEMIFPESQR